jgi:kynurenine 3-monooxygenase
MNQPVSILGAGLIGSVLGVYLKKRGLDVHIYDKRSDWRSQQVLSEGRSINMAISYRGWKALQKAGLKEKVETYTIPMFGRRIHDEHGKTYFQPYGKNDEAIYSVSRNILNQVLLDEAEREGVQLHFEHKVEHVDVSKNSIDFSLKDGQTKTCKSEVVFGADGAFSSLRTAMQKQMRLNFRQEYISHGYKELTIPATEDGAFAMDPNALHIWPRGNFMLIALPNQDKSFTCTLFMPFEDEKISFDKIRDEQDVVTFFQTYFNDAYQLMPSLTSDFCQNQTSALVNIECYPWTVNHCTLIGDAAHAIVPFYGQGMNSGFEDCFILDGLIEKYGTFSWDLVFEKFQKMRKPDTDAICKLAMDNFKEMRDKVSDPRFLIRKKIEAKLHELFPYDWVPLYSMVTFTDIKYSDAYAIGMVQEAVLDKVMSDPFIAQKWENLDYHAILDNVETSRAV